MAQALPVFPSFDPSEEGDVAVRWKRWTSRFKNLMVALNIDNDARQTALLLHYAGEPVNDIFDTLNTTPADDEKAIDKALTALTNHFQPQENTEWEVLKFRRAKQEKEEDLASFCTRLKRLSVTCGFTDANREIKSQIIERCSDSKLRLKLLDHEKRDWTLDRVVATGRAMELSKLQADDMELALHGSQSHTVNKVTSSPASSKPNHRRSHRTRNKPPRDARTRHPPDSKNNGSLCRRCGYEWPHAKGRESCPAFGQTCRKCNKQNHFQSCCQGSTDTASQKNGGGNHGNKHYKSGVHHVREQTDSDDDSYVYVMTHDSHGHGNYPMFEVTLCDTQFFMMADSGAGKCVLDEADYNQLKNKPPLNTTNIVNIYPYSSKVRLPIVGSFKAVIKSAKAESTEQFFVVKGASGSLLSWDASRRLGLISITVHNVTSTEKSQGSEDAPVEEFNDLFVGLGKLKDVQVSLHIDDSVPAVAQPHRRVPFHVRKQLEEQLENDEKLGVIERVDGGQGATPWVSPLVVVPKPKSPGKIRVCVDMREANKAIERERHLTPTINEIINDLNGAKVFTKLDLNQGYNQLELNPSSRYITTFSTHTGLWRYKRLNFGISSAAEVFQNAIREVLSGLQGAVNISDDILVYGVTQEEHDTNLRATFQRLRENGLTLNKDKCVYNKSTLEFFGYVFSDGGMSPDPKKVKDIIDFERPTNVSMVRSLLGMANFCARFIPGYATMTEPLRELTKKKTPWNWTEVHDKALSSIRSTLINAPVLAYFDINESTEIMVDASPVGLGAILVQRDSNGRRSTIAYASRALTPVEQRYSQTEREALAVVWACERFHIYVYGKPVTVYTDHKALVYIYGNMRSKPSARIERWAMRLQPYDATVLYQAGADNPADYLSRHPTYSGPSSREEKIAEEYINYISATSVPKAMSLESVRAETLRDCTLQAVLSALRDGQWHEHCKKPNVDTSMYNSLQKLKSELAATSEDDLLLRGSRIVIPTALQKQAVNLAHEGHQGLVKTKALIREKVWFPGIDSLVEQTVKPCLTCEIVTPKAQREPLKMSVLPAAPWKELSADFAELPGGTYLLVVTDDYSRFPVVEIIKSTSAQTVLPCLDRIFSEFGIPDTLRTDNGPPFNSVLFASFAKDLGFCHRKVTPYWPRANGEVERFMKTIKKSIKAAHVDSRNWKQAMHRFLRNYRATPHCSTGKPPATLLFSNAIKTKLPELTDEDMSRSGIASKDASSKKLMKDYADSKAYVKTSEIEVGDVVIVKQNPSYKKSDPPYRSTPYRVIQKRGSMVTAARGQQQVTRNSSFFKAVSDREVVDENVQDPDEDLFDDLGGGANDPPDIPHALPILQNAAPINQPQVAVRDRPQRDRRPPTRLKDYVLK